MITLLLAATTASADTDIVEACELGTLTHTLPGADATNVPTDLVPLLLWTGSCGIDSPITVTLGRAGLAEPVFQEEFGSEAFTIAGENWFLEPGWGALDADTLYTVTVADPYTETRQFSFTTGNGVVEPIAGGLPVVSIDYAAQQKLNRFTYPLEVELTLSSANDEGGAFVVREGGSERGVVLTDSSDEAVLLTWPFDARTREVCVTVVQRDGGGTWHGPSDEVCAKVEGARGCSHTAPWLGLFALLPALLTRRRRG